VTWFGGEPLVGKRLGPTFGRIVRNLGHAIDFFPVSVRMNVDRENFRQAEELLGSSTMRA
jgi:sulfatase maturation enzyme AslB (radical SAM superfamily)